MGARVKMRINVPGIFTWEYTLTNSKSIFCLNLFSLPSFKFLRKEVAHSKIIPQLGHFSKDVGWFHPLDL